MQINIPINNMNFKMPRNAINNGHDDGGDHDDPSDRHGGGDHDDHDGPSDRHGGDDDRDDPSDHHHGRDDHDDDVHGANHCQLEQISVRA